jgi:hypothetical protein
MHAAMVTTAALTKGAEMLRTGSTPLEGQSKEDSSEKKGSVNMIDNRQNHETLSVLQI